MEKWIVGNTERYYPYVEEFDSYEKAKEAFDNEKNSCFGANCYLAKVIEHKHIEAS